jgi:predicted ATPase/transcriptional regulator with XRE-family HTH domain
MPSEQSPSFGALVRRYRVAAGLSQEALAERAGLSARAISDLERDGQRTPRRDTLALLAGALDLAAPERALLEATVQRRRAPRASAGPAQHPAPLALSVPLTPLLGRDDQVAVAVDQLRRGDVRLLTLTGPGGVGKTRFALQMATILKGEWAGGVLVISLAPVTEAGLVASTLAQALGVQETVGRPLREGLVAALQEHELLMVLDNFEHVVAAAPLVTDLLLACPQLRILATSRMALRVSGEHEVPVPPLAVPALSPSLDVAIAARSPAVALFVQRAKAVKPDFALTADTVAAVVEVCHVLDGLPLALELAAAWIKLVPPLVLLARLKDRLPLLVGGPRDLPVRQQTLRATIDWSHALLEAEEQALFARLSVFVDGCTLEAAEAVCTVPGERPGAVLEGLAALLTKSLLMRGDEPDGTPRVAMLETLREYACERLATRADGDALRRAHAAYYLALAEEAARHLRGPEQRTWLARLEREHANLRAVLGWALAGGDVLLGLRVAGALGRFWEVRGYLSEGRGWLEGLLAGAGTPATGAGASARATALLRAGRLAWVQGEYERVTALAEESLTLCRELEDKGGIASSLTNLGIVAHNQGEYARAWAFHEESLAVRRALGDKEGIALSLTCLGRVAEAQGAYARGRALHEESLTLQRESGDKWGIAISLNNLGHLARLQGECTRARPLLEESLALSRELGDKGGIAWSLTNLGLEAHTQGDTTQARRLLKESLPLFRELGDRWGIAYSLGGVATVISVQGQPPETLARAVRLFGAAAALRATISASVPPNERADYDRTVTAVRTALGAAAFAAAWAEGQALTLEQALADALDGLARRV